MSDYDAIRHFADSYGLAAMVVIFSVFALWAFRPGSRRHYDEAAVTIFAEDEGEPAVSSKDKRHG